MEEFDVTSGRNRWRRITGITQPLGYETEELAKEDIENRQRTSPPLEPVIKKLFCLFREGIAHSGYAAGICVEL